MSAAKPLKLLLANGALLESPVYEEHSRGKNWLAVIDVDAQMPGGLSRRFMPRGRGECFYTIEQLTLHDAVEFGADYVTTYGNKKPLRWYGVVVALTDGYMLVEKCASGAKAVIRAKAARVSPEDKIVALVEDREAALRRYWDIDAEIKSLQAPEEEAAG